MFNKHTIGLLHISQVLNIRKAKQTRDTVSWKVWRVILLSQRANDKSMTSVCEWMLVASITHLPSHVDHSGRGYPLTSVHSPGNEKTRFSCSTMRARDLLSKNLYTDLICILYDHATERYKPDAPTPKKTLQNEVYIACEILKHCPEFRARFNCFCRISQTE